MTDELSKVSGVWLRKQFFFSQKPYDPITILENIIVSHVLKIYKKF